MMNTLLMVTLVASGAGHKHRSCSACSSGCTYVCSGCSSYGCSCYGGSFRRGCSCSCSCFLLPRLFFGLYLRLHRIRLPLQRVLDRVQLVLRVFLLLHGQRRRRQ